MFIINFFLYLSIVLRILQLTESINFTIPVFLNNETSNALQIEPTNEFCNRE